MRRWNGRQNGADNGNLAVDAIKGAIAGAIGVWCMDRVVTAMWDRTDPENRAREYEARPQGMDPAHVMANAAAKAVGVQLTPQQPHPAGMAVHYGLGVGPALAYGPLRHHFPAITTGGGALFGLALFFLQDEGANALLGTSGRPTDYPMEAHVRGFVGHLVFGVVTHTALELLDEVV